MRKHFLLFILSLGVLGLTAACGRSTTEPQWGSNPPADDGTETIEPEMPDTADDLSSEGTESHDVVLGPAANEEQAANEAQPEEEAPEVQDFPDVQAPPSEEPPTAREPEPTGPTYGDGGGGIPFHPEGEPGSVLNLPGSREAIWGAITRKSPGKVNVFFRNQDGHLCRVMGPPEATWNSENSRTACFNAYTIDRPPQVVFDPNRRKIYAFAPDIGDWLEGQTHGFRFYVCEADSIRCTASTHLLWENKFHFYPTLVFVKGATSAQDRVVGFTHSAGNGGRLAYFVVDPNPESLRHSWGYVGPKLLPGASETACGEWALIDRSPVAFFSDNSGGEALHVMGRTGDGDLLNLKMSSRHLAAFKRGEAGLKFSCQKISETFEGRDGIGNMGTRRRPFSLSPNAVGRAEGSIDVFGAVKAGDFSSFSARLWSIGNEGAVRQASWLEDLTTPSAYGPSMSIGLQMAPEERLALTAESTDPMATVHLFINGNQSSPAPGTEPEVTVHWTVSPGGENKTAEILPFRFGGLPATVTDENGNLHVFGATYQTGSNGHFRLLHATRLLEGDAAWATSRIALGRSIQKGGRGAGESGVTAVWVPGKSLLRSLMP
jgi:hypothetical protein